MYKLSRKEKGEYKSLGLMERDFVGCKGDKKKKEIKKLSPRILGLRRKSRERAISNR